MVSQGDAGPEFQSCIGCSSQCNRYRDEYHGHAHYASAFTGALTGQ